MTTSYQPQVKLNSPQAYGFRLSNDGTTPNTKLNVTAGICYDSTVTFQLQVETTLTVIDFGVVGLNGLDTGAIAVSTDYAIYAIGDRTTKNPTGFLASTDFTGNIILPNGYNIFKYIGSVQTDSSANLILFDQFGLYNRRIVQWRTPITVVSSGAITSSFVAKPLTAGMPPLQLWVELSVTWTPATAANALFMRPTGSASTNGLTVCTGPVVSQAFVPTPFWFYPGYASGQASVDVKGTAASTDVLAMVVNAYEDQI